MFQDHRDALQKLREDIELRGLSMKTHKNYVSMVSAFLEFCNKPLTKISEADGRRYMKHLIDKGLANATVNCHMASVRFFFACTLDTQVNYLQMPNMKKRKKLPVIMSVSEVDLLINHCGNLKRQSMILLAYGSGLRSSEIVRLKVKDIDSKNMRIFVDDGKGGKDRYAILSQTTLAVLRSYLKKYRPSFEPDAYLFPSRGSHVSQDALLNYVKEAAIAAGIKKDIVTHTLRHCFATHLLEAGTSLLKIKELMGHSCITSTTVYLQLAKFEEGIISPADKLADIHKERMR